MAAATEHVEVEIAASLDGIAAEWEDLAGAVGAAPFLRPAWFAAWSRAFASGTPQLLLARRERQLIGVLPMLRRRGSLLAAANWHTPAFDAVVADERAYAAFARRLVGGGPARLDVGFVPRSTPLVTAISDEADRAGLASIERVIERPPYLRLDGTLTDLERRLPTKRRADLRRRRRRLGEAGEVEIEVHRRPTALQARLSEGFAVEAAGWKGERGSAIASRPRTERFYREVAGLWAEQGWLRLFFLRLDRRPIAFSYCLQHGRALHVLKIGFDPAFSRFAPGMLLTREMLAYSFSERLQRYEFGGQDDPYKLIWTRSVHELVRIQVFAATMHGHVERLLWSRGRPIALRAVALARQISRRRQLASPP